MWSSFHFISFYSLSFSHMQIHLPVCRPAPTTSFSRWSQWAGLCIYVVLMDITMAYNDLRVSVMFPLARLMAVIWVAIFLWTLVYPPPISCSVLMVYNNVRAPPSSYTSSILYFFTPF